MRGGDDPGDDPLTQVGIWLRGDRGVLDARVLDQGDLDLTRADLETTTLDQVGFPAADQADGSCASVSASMVLTALHR